MEEKNKEEEELKEKLYKEHMAKKLINEDMITKKIAALDSYRIEKKSQNIAGMGILSAFLIVILSIMGITYASAGAAVSAFIFGFFLVKAKTRMQYLNITYDLKQKTGFNINVIDEKFKNDNRQ